MDDVICIVKNPSQYISQIEQEFKLRDATDEPSYYLGNDLKRLPNGKLHISTSTPFFGHYSVFDKTAYLFDVGV